MDTTLKQSLKAQAHHLKPVVMIGAKGLTQAVLDEAERTLLAHELIKIKITAEKEEKLQFVEKLCSSLQAELVQLIGNTAILYRKNEEKK